MIGWVVLGAMVLACGSGGDVRVDPKVRPQVWMDPWVVSEWRLESVEPWSSPRGMTEWALWGEPGEITLLRGQVLPRGGPGSAERYRSTEVLEESYRYDLPIEADELLAEPTSVRSRRIRINRDPAATSLEFAHIEDGVERTPLLRRWNGSTDTLSAASLEVRRRAWSDPVGRRIRFPAGSGAPAASSLPRYWSVLRGDPSQNTAELLYDFVESDQPHDPAGPDERVALLGEESERRISVDVRDHEDWIGYIGIEWARADSKSAWDTYRFRYVRSMPKVIVFGYNHEGRLAWRLHYDGPLHTLWTMTTIAEIGELTVLRSERVSIELDPEMPIEGLRTRALDLVAKLPITSIRNEETHTEVQLLHRGMLVREWGEREVPFAPRFHGAREYTYTHDGGGWRQFQILKSGPQAVLRPTTRKVVTVEDK